MKIKPFKAKIVRIGNSKGVIIPSSYFDLEIIDPNKTYEFEVVAVE